MSRHAALWLAVTAGAWREAPGRLLLTLFGIACGVALGAAVHLINATARTEFESAARALAGVADLVVRGPRQGFDESLYAHLAAHADVAAASPAVELEAALADGSGSLKLVGLDPFRAALVQPALIAHAGSDLMELLTGDAVWITQAAADVLGLTTGSALHLRTGTTVVTLRVAGIAPYDAYPGRAAIGDIATVQWRLGQVGRLQRIDLRLQPGVDPAQAARELAPLLPAGVTLAPPDIEASRASAMTRAYRLNLDMLALVALFTGAFLVFSAQFLALMRRRTHFALVRVLGVTRRELAGLLLAEGALLGAVGASLGVAAGHYTAATVLAHHGADLGAGFLREGAADLVPQWSVYAGYFALGLLFAVIGAAPSAFEAARRAPALALRAGDEQEAQPARGRLAFGVALLVAGGSATQLPAWEGLPWAGYAAVALLLVGTVVILPALARATFGRLPTPAALTGDLAINRARGAPRQSAITVAAIVCSLSLMTAMLVMIASFRGSLDAWLHHMLPADAYLRSAPHGETGAFSAVQQDVIRTTPGVADVRFIRAQQLLLRADRPPVTLLARDTEPTQPDRDLALQSAFIVPARDAPPPVWISEAVHDVYGWQVGAIVELPLAGRAHAFTVAGVWRDYARQTGAVVIEPTVYVALTGDRLANDAALWLARGATLAHVADAVRGRLGADGGYELTDTASLRAKSLAIFDRTFAVTYALEAVAILIGLMGVSTAFSAQALARRREFGVLRHLGMTRRRIGLMLAAEGGLLAAFGGLVGLLLGLLIGLILIHVVNRQSFHWSMDLDIPAGALALLAAVLVVCAASVAVWSGRYAMRDEAARAVREDW